MARKSKDGPNRSDAIRAYLENNKGAKPAEIKEALGKQGIEVSDSLISAVKYKKPKGRGGRRKGRKPGRPPAAAANGRASSGGEKVSVDSLMAAKQLVNKLGSVEAAAQAIEVYRRLQI